MFNSVIEDSHLYKFAAHEVLKGNEIGFVFIARQPSQGFSSKTNRPDDPSLQQQPGNHKQINLKMMV